MSGQLLFSTPVNLTFLSQGSKFLDMFDFGWYSDEDQNQLEPYKWENVTAEHFGDDNMTVNFTV